METQIISRPSPLSVGEAMLDHYLELARGHNAFAVGLPGGRSVIPFLQALVANEKQIAAILRRTIWFQTDEFAASEERAETNFELLQREFFSKVESVRQDAIFRIGPLKPPADRGGWPNYFRDQAHEYENRLVSGLNRHRMPNLVILGIGGGNFPDGTPDRGHVAGIFPGRIQYESSMDDVAVESHAPKPPEWRVTVTPFFLVNRAKHLAGVLLGEERRASYEAFLKGGSWVETPSRLIEEKARRFEGSGVLFTDLLKKRVSY